MTFSRKHIGSDSTEFATHDFQCATLGRFTDLPLDFILNYDIKFRKVADE